jgi:hypothetical protein
MGTNSWGTVGSNAPEFPSTHCWYRSLANSLRGAHPGLEHRGEHVGTVEERKRCIEVALKI